MNFLRHEFATTCAIVVFLILFFGDPSISLNCYGSGTSKDLTVTFNSSEGTYTVTPENAGIMLTPSETQNEPSVTWDRCSGKYYSFLMVDPDAPTPQDPTLADILHWMVIDITSCNVDSGDVKMEFKGPAPPNGSDPHRYCLFMFETDVSIEWPTPESRYNFNMTAFEIYINNTQGGRVEGSSYFMAQFEGNKGKKSSNQTMLESH